MSRLHKKNKVLESEVDVTYRAIYDYDVKMNIRPFKFVYNLDFLTRVGKLNVTDSASSTRN